MRAVLIWTGLALALAVPLWLAAQSPLLQYRQPAYILGGFAGIVGLGVMLLQPLLAGGALPGVAARFARRAHRWIGTALVALVIAHIAGLWFTSPPDVIDVLLFRSPTPFGLWGALAMWAVFASAALALFRRRLAVRVWRAGHRWTTGAAVLGTVLHAVLIQGAMESYSKWALCAAAVLATALAARAQPPFMPRRKTAPPS